MSAPADRPVPTNLFRPSLLAWRAKHRAEKAAKSPPPTPAPKPADAGRTTTQS